MAKITHARGAHSKHDPLPPPIASGGPETGAAADNLPSLPRPPVKAPKGEWVAYAEALGVDSSGSKKEIIGRIGVD